MRAVILAGGEGRRLRPLTNSVPKPMLKLCGRPMLEYVIEMLARNGVTEAVLTLGYKPETVQRHFKAGTHAGVKLGFCVEQAPLGTAGGVKNAIGDTDEDFIVISGDALCDFDLSAAIERHRVTGAEATIITKQVDDPREYGLADVADDGCIRGFAEKPGWQDAFTDCANTGIYIISGLFFRGLPEGEKLDFAKDVFPKMVAKGTLFAFMCEGYWRDVGDPSAYLAAQQDIINRRVECKINVDCIGGSRFAAARPDGNYVIEAPCYIGKNVKIGDGAIIGPDTIVSDGAVIGEKARATGCFLGESSVLGDNARARGCIICDGSGTGRNSTAASGSVIGPRSLLGDDAVLGEGVTLAEFEVIPDESIVVQTPSEGGAKPPRLTADSVAGRLGSCVTPMFCLEFGAALARVFGASPVCVADDGLNSSYIHKQILVCGVLAGGGQVYDTGVMFRGQLRYAVSESGSRLGILVSGYGQGLQLVGTGAEGIPRELQKELEKLVSRPAVSADSDVIRLPEMLSGITALWENRLLSSLPTDRLDFEGSFFCKTSAVAETAAKLFMQLGGRSGSALSFNISQDGSTANISRGGEIAVTYEQLLGICADADFARGCDVIVNSDAPRTLERIASERGRRVFRRPYCAEQSVWCSDGVSALLYAMAVSGSREKLLEAAANLPSVGVFTKELDCSGTGTAAVMGRLLRRDGVRTEQGVAMATASGWITARPSADGKTVKIISEATSQETAMELCAYFEKWIDL